MGSVQLEHASLPQQRFGSIIIDLLLRCDQKEAERKEELTDLYRHRIKPRCLMGIRIT